MRSYKCCHSGSLKLKKISSLSSLLKTVAEESRLKLLCILQTDKHCVCEMMEYVDMSQSLISHHLADLREKGLVADNKEGQRVYYRLTDLGEKIMTLINEIET